MIVVLEKAAMLSKALLIVFGQLTLRTKLIGGGLGSTADEGRG